MNKKFKKQLKMLLEFDQYFKNNYIMLNAFGVFIKNKNKIFLAFLILICSNIYSIFLAALQIVWLYKIGYSDPELSSMILSMVLPNFACVLKVNKFLYLIKCIQKKHFQYITTEVSQIVFV